MTATLPESAIGVITPTLPHIGEQPYYRPQGEEVELFSAAKTRRLPVLLKGPTGCGKTRFVEYMAWQLGRPLVTVACHDDLSTADLIGRYLVIGQLQRTVGIFAPPRVAFGYRRINLAAIDRPPDRQLFGTGQEFTGFCNKGCQRIGPNELIKIAPALRVHLRPAFTGKLGSLATFKIVNRVTLQIDQIENIAGVVTERTLAHFHVSCTATANDSAGPLNRLA